MSLLLRAVFKASRCSTGGPDGAGIGEAPVSKGGEVLCGSLGPVRAGAEVRARLLAYRPESGFAFWEVLRGSDSSVRH
jgi:hypothetical protein